MPRQIDFAAVAAYVEKRRKSTGGYGATPRLPATIEDTFEAVAIADILSAMAPGSSLPHPPSGDNALHEYLLAATRRSWPGLRTSWQLLHTCRRLGLAVDPAPGEQYLLGNRAADNSLYTDYYTTKILAVLGLPGTHTRESGPTTLPGPLTVAETLMSLEIRKTTGDNLSANNGLLVAWLQSCQNGDGGFGFFPGTTSFIENCHYALAAISLLGVAPATPDTARQFIISCQTGAGGFGRNLRAAPFLDATWHALAAFQLLDASAGSEELV